MTVTPDMFHAQLTEDISRGAAFVPEASANWACSAYMHQYREGVLAEWLGWVEPWHAVWNEELGYHVPQHWIETSRFCHEKVVRQLLGMPYNAKQHGHVDFYNATDYLFQTLLGGGDKVLDFGAGYGRQSFLWTTQNQSLTYVAVDGIEGPYLLQNKVLQCLENVEFYEYMNNPDSFAVMPLLESTPGAYHLPTWRLDLLPDDFFDLIICVQVLQELPGALIQPLLNQFRRIIAPGGKLYIRDHEYWRPSHRFKIGKYLLQTGWRLAFRHPGIDKRDIHGIPRIWFYTGEDTSELTTIKSIAKRFYWYVRSTRGRLRFDDILDPFLPM